MSNLALAKKTVVLTHPFSTKSEDFCQLFRDEGARVFHFPLIKTVSMLIPDTILSEIDQYDYLIFTSQNGVKYFFADERLIEKVRQSNCKIISIGKQTSNSLSNLGLETDFCPKAFNSDQLIVSLKNEYLLENKSILLVQGQLAPDKILNALSSNNSVKRINVYQTKTPNSCSIALEALCLTGKIDYIVFTSPSGFQGFTENYSQRLKNNPQIVSIGPITSQKIESENYKVDLTAEESTYQGIYQTIINNI